MSTAAAVTIAAPETRNDLGYHAFTAGQFRFLRDEYFAHIYYPGGRHVMHIDAFLRAVMRDVGWASSTERSTSTMSSARSIITAPWICSSDC